MKVKDIYSAPAVTASPDDSVSDAAQIMQQHNIGSLPIVEDGGKLVGILTDRDIVIRNTAREMDPTVRTVSEIMTSRVHTVNVYDSVEDAASIMANKQVKRLPVMDGERVAGLVALGDIATSDHKTESANRALEGISCGCHQKYPQND